ncbi:MAG: hypothetical protein JSR18_07995 [Proteobacteria bacterium]|nr:hypothetical protein [Pseudomonadota bacterium]
MLMREYKALADDHYDKALMMESVRAFAASSVWYDTEACCGPAFDTHWQQDAGFNRLAIIDRANAPYSSLLSPVLAAIFARLPDTIAGAVIRAQGTHVDIVIVAGPASVHHAFECLARADALEPGIQLCSTTKDDPQARAIWADIERLPPSAAGARPGH